MPKEDQLSEKNLDNYFRFGGNQETPNFKQETRDEEDGPTENEIPSGFHIIEEPINEDERHVIPVEYHKRLTTKQKHVEMSRMS